MVEVSIAEHAFRHGVSQEDTEHAWENFVRMQFRGAPHEGQIVLVGVDTRGKLIELVAAERPGGILIYHAMRPPTRSVLLELGMEGR